MESLNANIPMKSTEQSFHVMNAVGFFSEKKDRELFMHILIWTYLRVKMLIL